MNDTGKPEGICRGPGCTEPTEWGRGAWSTRRRLHCSTRCQQRAWHVTRSGRAYRAAWTKQRRHATLGRQCVACSVNDKEALWSANNSLCSACQRLASRNGRCNCGKILRRTGGRPLFCHACDGRVLLSAGYAQVILLHPADDRERLIWKSNNRIASERRGFEFGEVHTATPSQWTRWK